MRGLTLYARSRQVPGAVAAATGAAVVMWLVDVARDNDHWMSGLAVLTVLMVLAALTVTLGGPDDGLDRTAARPWRWLRAGHLLLVLVLVLGLVLAAHSGTDGTVRTIVRNGSGLLGLTALGAATIGPARAWFLPIGWTLAALSVPSEGTLGAVLAWQVQTSGSRPAAAVAAVLAVSGSVAYVARGPRPRVVGE